MRALFLVAAALPFACSSSRTAPVDAPDAGRETGRSTGEDAAMATPDATASDGPATDLDGSRSPKDAHPDTFVVSFDAFVITDAFVYPDGAIPHDAQGDGTSGSPCSDRPDDSFFCASSDAGESGYYTCMQGVAVYSACQPGTLCAATDAGAVACQAP